MMLKAFSKYLTTGSKNSVIGVKTCSSSHFPTGESKSPMYFSSVDMLVFTISHKPESRAGIASRTMLHTCFAVSRSRGALSISACPIAFNSSGAVSSNILIISGRASITACMSITADSMSTGYVVDIISAIVPIMFGSSAVSIFIISGKRAVSVFKRFCTA